MIAEIILGSVAFLLLITILAGIRIIRPQYKGLVERWGRYHRLAKPGINFIVPFAERLIKVNMTERMVTLEQGNVITKDSLNTHVSVQVYYQVKDNEDSIKSTQYNANNFRIQIHALAISTLRNLIGTMNLMEINSKRAEINKKLSEAIKTGLNKWGVEIIRTELKEINPPQEVQQAMNGVVEAKSKKEATILKAEGEAEAIKKVNDSAEKSFKPKAQRYKTLSVTENSLKNNSKIVLTSKGIDPVLVMDGNKVVPIKKK